MCDAIERMHGTHEHATPILRHIIAVIPEGEFSLLDAIEAFHRTQFVQPVGRHIDLDTYVFTFGEEVGRAGKRYAVKHKKCRHGYVLGSYVIALQFILNYAELSAHLRRAHNGQTYAEVMAIQKLFRTCDVTA